MEFPLVIELAGKPKGQKRAQPFAVHGKIVGKFTTKETRIYESALKMAGQQAMNRQPPLQDALAVDVIAVFPIAQSWAKKKQASALAGTAPPCVKPDHDNLAKSLDALNGIVWGDDKQIVFSRVFKIYGERPCLRVVVNRADGDGFVEAQRLLHIPLAAVA